MTSNNVIVFPRENKNIKKMISIDEINHNVEQMNLYHIQETIISIVPIVFNQLEVAGFYATDMEEEEAVRHGAFMVEAIRSFLCQHYGIYHPFQRITDCVFEPDETEDGSLKVVDRLEVDLKEEDELDEE